MTRPQTRNRYRALAALVLLTVWQPASADIELVIEGVDEPIRLNLLVFLSVQRYRERDDLPAETVERERGILAARAAESGKPAEIVARMVEGGLNKFLAESTLLGQPFVKDDKQSVEKMLAAKKSKLLGFRFLVVGEGIEKKASDFAAEVMSMVKN